MLGHGEVKEIVQWIQTRHQNAIEIELTTEEGTSTPVWTVFRNDLKYPLRKRAVDSMRLIADTLSDEATEKGTITVATRRAGESVEIIVRDTGTGIPEEVRARIFDPFFTTKDVGKGTGQGLAIARSVVVDKHGGTIDCQTKEGTGTTFMVRLPIDGMSQSQEADEYARSLC